MEKSKSYWEKMQDTSESRGWSRDLKTLTPSQYREVAIAVRSIRQVVKDGAKAVATRVSVAAGISVVPLTIAASNEAKCRACPHGAFTELVGGEPACNVCSCSSKWLKAKWASRKGRCPKGVWDNRLVQIGDSDA